MEAWGSPMGVLKLEVTRPIQRLGAGHNSRGTDEGGGGSLDILTPAGHSSHHRIQNDPGHSRGSPRRGGLVALVVQLKQAKGKWFKGSPS